MIGKIILVIFIIVALGTSSYLVYTIYQDNYSPVNNFNVNYTQLESEPSYLQGLQAFPNMRFDHTNLSYFSDSSCSGERITRLEEAFSILEQRTGILNFYRGDENSDIITACSDEELEQEDNMFIAGMGGAEGEMPFTGIYYIIPKGNVTLYRDIECDKPIVELHELLHVFGFNHSTNENSVMYPIASCSQVLTNDIVDELKRLYSIKALPDLYFSSVNAAKQGRYLNLNFTIRNQGLKESGDFAVIIYSREGEERRFSFVSMVPGAGAGRTIQNLRVSSSDFFTLSINNSIELNEENNIAELTLS
jgi:hypothetical protein